MLASIMHHADFNFNDLLVCSCITGSKHNGPGLDQLFGFDFWIMVSILAGGGALLLLLICVLVICACRRCNQQKKELGKKTFHHF